MIHATCIKTVKRLLCRRGSQFKCLHQSWRWEDRAVSKNRCEQCFACRYKAQPYLFKKSRDSPELGDILRPVLVGNSDCASFGIGHCQLVSHKAIFPNTRKYPPGAARTALSWARASIMAKSPLKCILIERWRSCSCKDKSYRVGFRLSLLLWSC